MNLFSRFLKHLGSDLMDNHCSENAYTRAARDAIRFKLLVFVDNTRLFATCNGRFSCTSLASGLSILMQTIAGLNVQ